MYVWILPVIAILVMFSLVVWATIATARYMGEPSWAFTRRMLRSLWTDLKRMPGEIRTREFWRGFWRMLIGKEP